MLINWYLGIILKSKHMKNSIIIGIIGSAVLAVIITMIISAAAEDCMICVPFPKATHADKLVESETVVLARENMDKPFFLRTVDVLKGAVDNPEIDSFINSFTRRKLKLNPNDVIVLGRMGSSEPWRHIAYADADYLTIICAIINRSDSWQAGRGDRMRINLFAEYLTHENPLIREQAYLEVGRAPYAMIKRTSGSVPRRQIREFLANWQLLEWHSLYILMRGQSRAPDDIAYIRKKFESAARYGLETNLSAWVTAFIETHPDTGIEEVEAKYYLNADRSRTELEEVLKGLSVLGSEGGLATKNIVKRRRRIIKSYAKLLDYHPQMAGWVAKDLTVWKIRAMVERMERINSQESNLDASSKLAVNYYLSVASQFPSFGRIH